MLAIALELLSMLDEETVVAEEEVPLLKEDSVVLDGAVVSLEDMPELLSIESESAATLELSLSPHAEIKNPDISTMQE